jgi:DNA-binding GntR family transcriptional regulator
MTTDRRKTPLSILVAEALRQSLQDGVYRPGERLAESVIAREMSVSQNTARDALTLLEGEGWLVKQPRRGMRVREFTIAEVRELYTLRATLEQLAFGWALETITEQAKMQLANAISQARLQAGIANRRGLHEAIFSFHEMILALAARPQTTVIVTSLHNQCRLLEHLRTEHAPIDKDEFNAVINDYGDLMTRIRYNERQAALNTLYDMILEEGRKLLPVLDLVT